MGVVAKDGIVSVTGRLLNDVFSIIVFSVLDLLDFLLCYAFKIADFLIEAEWKACYCCSAKEAITGSGKILVSEQGESKKIVRVSCSKLQLEEISDTLYTRPSFVSEIYKSKTKIVSRMGATAGRRSTTTANFTVNPTIIEMLQGRIGRHQNISVSTSPNPRWSDCDCKTCTSWTTSSSKETLFVKADGAQGI